MKFKGFSTLQIVKSPFFWVAMSLLIFKDILFSKKQTVRFSSNDLVNDSIFKLDTSIDRLGTDEEMIFNVFKSLTSSEIKMLFKDFGTRFYNKYTGKYKFISTGSFGGMTKEMNLKSILIEEMRVSELDKLKDILSSKGVLF